MASFGSGDGEAGVNPMSKGTLPMSLWVSDSNHTDLAELWLKYGFSPSIVMRVPKYKKRGSVSRGG